MVGGYVGGVGGDGWRSRGRSHPLGEHRFLEYDASTCWTHARILGQGIPVERHQYTYSCDFWGLHMFSFP